MTVTVKVEGLRELDQQLERLKAGTGKGAVRRALKKAAEPMAAKMRAGAPRKTGKLAISVAVTSKLSRRQAGLHRKMFSDDRAAVEMFVGPGPLTGIVQEFGTWFHPPQPFVRPVWDADQRALLDRLRAELKSEIDKAIARGAKRGTLIG
jgi:HK97 gp10 family phage protein